MDEMKILEYKVNDNHKPIIIYGASVGGAIIYHILVLLGTEIEFFCDRNSMISSFMGKEVKNPQLVDFDNYTVIVSATRAFNSVVQYLLSRECKVAYIFSEMLKNYADKLDMGSIPFEEEAVKGFCNKYVYYANEWIEEKSLVLPTFDVVLSEVCNLRCRDCSALIPYFKKPCTYEADLIIQDMETILSSVESIVELVLVGGEPFIYPNLGLVIDFLAKQDKIKYITIVTNGTMLPNKDLVDFLKNTKIRIRISDYGSVSKQKKELQCYCNLNGIHSYMQKQDHWIDMGKPFKRDYTDEELSHLFIDCPFCRSQGLLNGKIFRCMHAAEIYHLREDIEVGDDFLDIRDPNIARNLSKHLRDFLFKKMTQELCGFCDGVYKNVEGIEPAIQMKGLLTI